MEQILCVGMAGVGKTSVCGAMRACGIEAYDLETIDGMFVLYQKSTGRPFTHFNAADPRHISDAQWVCEEHALRSLLRQQRRSIAFYFGIMENEDEVFPLFDRVLLLRASSQTLSSRLKTREHTKRIGNAEEARRALLFWKEIWEPAVLSKGAQEVSAEGSVGEVASRIVRTVSSARSAFDLPL